MSAALKHRHGFTMKLILFTFLTILSIFLTVDSQHIPKTCQCPQVKEQVRGPFSDFKVTPKGPSCLKDEIIVTLQSNDRQVCLSPEGRQGKRLMKCWHRNNKDSKKCLQRLKRRRRNQIKSKKHIS